MRKILLSGVAAGLMGSAMLMSGPSAAPAATLSAPGLSAASNTAMVQEVRDSRSRRMHYSGRSDTWHYDRYRHGNRYRHSRHGFRHHHGGYYYSYPWWNGPSIGFGLTVPGMTYGLGVPSSSSAHVNWCLNRFRSYDVGSDTYLGYDGRRHRCNSPYR